MGNTPNIRFKGFTNDWEQRQPTTLCYSVITTNNGLQSIRRGLFDLLP